MREEKKEGSLDEAVYTLPLLLKSPQPTSEENIMLKKIFFDVDHF